MSGFEASNGIIVDHLVADNEWTVDPLARRGDHARLSASQMDALREFFQAKDDERLERWRWPEAPDWVVYHWGQPQSAGVVVVSETVMIPSRVIHRDADSENPTPEYRAARAYFEAQSDRKPAWHDAAVISWKEGPNALLPHVALRYPASEGGRDLGWHVDLGYSGAIWHSLEAITAAIGDAEVTVLVPEVAS